MQRTGVPMQSVVMMSACVILPSSAMEDFDVGTL